VRWATKSPQMTDLLLGHLAQALISSKAKFGEHSIAPARSARTAAELVPIAGYYGLLVHAQ